jgi:hypothetical protein
MKLIRIFFRVRVTVRYVERGFSQFKFPQFPQFLQSLSFNSHFSSFSFLSPHKQWLGFNYFPNVMEKIHS